MNFFLPLHCDAGNRGCDGIARGTSIILSADSSHIYSLSGDSSLDRHLGLDKFVTLIPTIGKTRRKSIGITNKILRILNLHKFQLPLDEYKDFYSRMKDDDIVLSTGGDLMCYNSLEAVETLEKAKEMGHRVFLWGCSMGPENLTPEKLIALKGFSLIYVRETLSYEFFKSLGLDNLYCIPDPAFILEPEKCELPSCFNDSEVIGINVSNYVLGGFSSETNFGKEVCETIEYIIKKTNLHILLVPHVTWSDQDDRAVCEIFYQKFKSSKRISVLDINNLNYLKIRYVISKCRFFIGGRTHSVISAYSTGVPCIAIGYSIKARGIAKDLGLPENLVVDSKKTVLHQLLNSFKHLQENEIKLRSHLKEVMPCYRDKVFQMRDIINTIIENK